MRGSGDLIWGGGGGGNLPPPPIWGTFSTWDPKNGSQPKYSPRLRCHTTKRTQKLCATCCNWHLFVSWILASYCSRQGPPLGTGKVNRSDEFSEKFQTAFDPPPHFRKVTLRFSRQNCDKSAYVHMEEHLCILWSYFPWDACSTNVQHGNRVKTYPKRPFCITFMLKKPCLKVQILQYKFLDWKWPPPPFRNFSENSSDLLTLPIPYF